MKKHNTDFWPFLDYFNQYHKYNEAREGFFFLGPLRTIQQLFPEQKTKCVSVLVCKIKAYNKTQVQKLHLTFIIYICLVRRQPDCPFTSKTRRIDLPSHHEMAAVIDKPTENMF